MRKTLSYLFILLCVAACSDNEDPKGIVSVETLTNIRVLFGTAFNDIGLPIKATVHYSDNTSEEVTITFDQGNYNPNVAGNYDLEATLTLSSGTVNEQNLKATITITVATLKLKTVSIDGNLRYSYFYNDNDRLDYFLVNSNDTKYTYSYDANDRVTQRTREVGGLQYPEKYFYHASGKLDRIEFYSSTNVLAQTHTYAYAGEKIDRYDNSDQSIAGLKFRTFMYDGIDVTKVSFDVGNSWNYTYLKDKKVFTPLILDLANPQNQVTHPAASFTYVELNTYTSVYEYNAQGYPTKETRTYPGDNNRVEVVTNTYQ
jgi:hypothetical protein